MNMVRMGTRGWAKELVAECPACRRRVTQMLHAGKRVRAIRCPSCGYRVDPVYFD